MPQPPTPPRLKFPRDGATHPRVEHPNKAPPPPTPTVTGLSYPTPCMERPPAPEPFSTPQGSSDGSFDLPVTPPDYESLDQLWGNIRHEKELKEAKSRPKVKSLEATQPPQVPSAPIQQTLKKKRSHCTFRESPDGRTVTATFDPPGIKKQDVHISFQRNRLVVSWQTVHVTEREENGRLVRECKKDKELRTIPLPEGTKFEEVHANMDHRHLTLTYPNMRSVRAEARPKTPAAGHRA